MGFDFTSGNDWTRAVSSHRYWARVFQDNGKKKKEQSPLSYFLILSVYSLTEVDGATRLIGNREKSTRNLGGWPILTSWPAQNVLKAGC